MYQITKLSGKSQLFISNLNTSGKSMSLSVSIALARILAYSEPLPTSELADLESYFKTQIRVNLEMKVSCLNELIALDTKAIVDLVYRFYSYRHYTTVACTNLIAINKDTALEDFFKISKAIDHTTLECIKENCGYITELTLGFNKLLEDIA